MVSVLSNISQIVQNFTAKDTKGESEAICSGKLHGNIPLIGLVLSTSNVLKKVLDYTMISEW